MFAVLAQGQEMRRYVKRRLLGAPAVLFVLVNLLVDLTYGLFDPRVRLSSGAD